MSPKYNRAYAPVLRSPLLFRQAPGQSAPNYYPAQYTLRPQYTVQAQLPMYNYSPIPLSAPSIPDLTYSTTVSSKGLSLILIAILILVALDLMIVRPQKLNMLEVRDSKTEYRKLG